MKRVRGRRLAPAKKLASFLHSQSLPLPWGIPPKEEEENSSLGYSDLPEGLGKGGS
jgi:hypothetical protein